MSTTISLKYEKKYSEKLATFFSIVTYVTNAK